MQSAGNKTRSTRPLPSPPPPPSRRFIKTVAPRSSDHHKYSSLGLDGLSLIDRAHALCAAADDVQRATVEASRRIAAIHGSPERASKNRKTNKKPHKPAEEPPDVCARPPSDVPPPRGEGWRRLAPVSVVRGSNRLSAPPQARRALTRDIEVFIDGKQYCIVPADIDPGGGFCVTLNRDFQGETNMASMLYVRNPGVRSRPGGGISRPAEQSSTRRKSVDNEVNNLVMVDEALASLLSHPTSKVVSSPYSSLPPSKVPPAYSVAPFGSVGESMLLPVPRQHAASPSPFSVNKQHDLDMFITTRGDDRNSAKGVAVQDAQRRARRRALSQRKRASEENAEKLEEHHPHQARNERPEAKNQRLQASRRAALARIALVKRQKERRRKEAERVAEEAKRQKGLDAAAKSEALRAAAVARVAIVAAEQRQHQRAAEETKEAEARARRERMAAVLARKDSDTVEREKQVRAETYRRIRKEERRRELERQREEDEWMDRIRLYEAGERNATATLAHRPPLPAAPPRLPVAQPALQSARSFFSVNTRASSQQSLASSGYVNSEEGAVITAAPETAFTEPEFEVPEDSDRDRYGRSNQHKSLGAAPIVNGAPSPDATCSNVNQNDDRGSRKKQYIMGCQHREQRNAYSNLEDRRKITESGSRQDNGTTTAAQATSLYAVRGCSRHSNGQQHREVQHAEERQHRHSHQVHRTKSRRGSQKSYSSSCPPTEVPIRGESARGIMNHQESTTTLDRAENVVYKRHNTSRGEDTESTLIGTDEVVVSSAATSESRKGSSTRRVSALASPQSLPGGGPESFSGETTNASVSSGSVSCSGKGTTRLRERKRISATPVWKRPVVPLSKPYVPVPRKDSNRFTVR